MIIIMEQTLPLLATTKEKYQEIMANFEVVQKESLIYLRSRKNE